MAKAEPKKQKRSFIVSLLIITVISCFVISLINTCRQVSETEKEIAAVQAECAEQNAENTELRQKLNSGDIDEYVEEVARDRLGYVMPGERVYYDISVDD